MFEVAYLVFVRVQKTMNFLSGLSKLEIISFCALVFGPVGADYRVIWTFVDTLLPCHHVLTHSNIFL